MFHRNAKPNTIKKTFTVISIFYSGAVYSFNRSSGGFFFRIRESVEPDL